MLRWILRDRLENKSVGGCRTMGGIRTSATLGVVEAKVYGYGHKYTVFWSGIHTDRGAGSTLDGDASTARGSYLKYALTPAGSLPSTPVLRATWMA